MGADTYCLTCTVDGAIEADLLDLPEVGGTPPVAALFEQPDGTWRLDIHCTARPGTAEAKALQSAIERQAGISLPPLTLRCIRDRDWISESQKHLKPVEAGRFRIRPSHAGPGADRSRIELIIDAAEAFGTGHHETTLGCLDLLDRMEREKARPPETILDVGTGTGILALAAHRLWPGARIIASDIDPKAITVAERTARQNDVTPVIPGRPGIAFLETAGMDHRAIGGQGPCDLIIANILAGPLVDMAPEISGHTAKGGRVVLSGLMEHQEDTVANAYKREGVTIEQRIVHGEWPTLQCRKE